MTWFSGLFVVALLGLGSPEIARADGPQDGPLVVVDPGHGGSNSGAPGAREGALEKQVTLELARELAAALRRLGVRVALTRDRDRYLTLRQRSDIANRLEADVFVSVHVNASLDHSRTGFETYVLDDRAVAIDAPALRAGSGRPRPGLEPRLARLLDDLERNLARPSSRRVAAAIQAALARARPGTPDRGVKESAMHVLLGATMPAVLVEVGFFDHPVEGLELADPAVQRQIAEAIAVAIAGEVASPDGKI
jgi:N-acetylmuramoyl-L-alanine amidase